MAQLFSCAEQRVEMMVLLLSTALSVFTFMVAAVLVPLSFTGMQQKNSGMLLDIADCKVNLEDEKLLEKNKQASGPIFSTVSRRMEFFVKLTRG